MTELSKLHKLTLYLREIGLNEEADLSENKSEKRITEIENVVDQIREYEERYTENADAYNENLKNISELRKRKTALEHSASEINELCDKKAAELSHLQGKLKISQQASQSISSDYLKLNLIFDQIEEILGVSAIIEQVICDTTYRLKISYSKDRFIHVDFNAIQQSFDLVKMIPTHPKFDLIKEFLTETSDFTGFICQCRTFYNSPLESFNQTN